MNIKEFAYNTTSRSKMEHIKLKVGTKTLRLNPVVIEDLIGCYPLDSRRDLKRILIEEGEEFVEAFEETTGISLTEDKPNE